MDGWATNGKFQPGSGALSDYAERYTYDPNGNILTLSRTGDSLHPATAQLSYHYIYAKTGGGTGEYVPGSAPTSGVAHLTNQLSSIGVTSSGGAANPNELANQSAFNYQYNEIGQLTADSKAQISGVVWNVYGKILSLTDSGNTISFTYDATGNRISKRAHGITTWYVRDAQGNVMSVYTQGNSAVHGDSLTQTEADVYGSNRLGLLNLSVNCISLAVPDSGSLVRGNKLFELTNHWGNVLETISDKKIQHTSDNSTVDYYLADVIGANDYYSGGMLMPVRQFGTLGRYAFNGKEQDPEVKGPGDQYDYGMRGYDPRGVRFWSVDPLKKKYPYYSPYQFAGNNPIKFIDLDGLEPANNPTTPGTKEKVAMATVDGINAGAARNDAQSNLFSSGPYRSSDQTLKGTLVHNPKGTYVTDTKGDPNNKFNMVVNNGTTLNVDESQAAHFDNYEAFVVDRLTTNFATGKEAENYNFPTNGIISSKFLSSDILTSALSDFNAGRLQGGEPTQYNFGAKELGKDL